MKKLLVIFAAFCIVSMSACFSTWDGSDDEGSIVISLGNSGARAGQLVNMGNDKDVTEEEPLEGTEVYEITISGPGGEFNGELTGADRDISFSVQPGLWNVLVSKYVQDADQTRILKGFGKKINVEVKAGPPTPAEVVVDKVTKEVDNWSDLRKVFEKNDGNKEIVIITTDLSADSSMTLGDKQWNITLLAETPVTITKSYTSGTADAGNSLFRVLSGCELTLGGTGKNITITSNTTANGYQYNSSLAYVQGTLIMNKGVTLSGNVTNAGSSSANDKRGGAVSVYGGTFEMNGGDIYGNSTVTNGGGVYVNSGTFIKTGGTIYGYTEGDSNSNKANGQGLGHAVYGPGTRAIDTTLGPNDNL